MSHLIYLLGLEKSKKNINHGFQIQQRNSKGKSKISPNFCNNCQQTLCLNLITGSNLHTKDKLHQTCPVLESAVQNKPYFHGSARSTAHTVGWIPRLKELLVCCIT